MAPYLRCTYRLPGASEEALAALLWAVGTTGTQTTPVDPATGDPLTGDPTTGTLEETDGSADEPGELVLLEAFFSVDEAEAVAGLRLPAGVERVSQEVVEPSDWLEAYRRFAVPLNVGERLILDPREPEESAFDDRQHGMGSPSGEGRILLRLPARQAFGTGSHESTRLILQLMERADFSHRRVLDVGSGSGVLSFAALAFGAAFCVGLEIDLPSAFMAYQNRALNGLHPAFVAGGLNSCAASGSFEIALVNILPERILPTFHLLPPLLNERAELLLSGIVHDRAAAVLEAVAPWGFRPVDTLEEGDWVAFRCRR